MDQLNSDYHNESIHTSPQFDRFKKRLDLYRSHQNECKIREDNSLKQLNEQQNHEIEELQKKSKKAKQKRVNKRGFKKQMDIDKTKQMLMNETLPTTSSQNIKLNNFHQPAIKHEFPQLSHELEDLEDIDFKGIKNLVSQVEQPLTSDVLNFDDNPMSSNQFLLPYQYFNFNDFHNYHGILFNPNWMS